MNLETREVVGISQWLEDRPLEFVREIDFAFDAVVEAKPKDVVTHVTSGDDMREHRVHSNGSIRESG
jgi:hypothetical protein